MPSKNVYSLVVLKRNMNNSNLIIEPIKGDERGSIFCGKVNGLEQFLITEIKKGKKRGGHYHNVDTFHFVLVGSVKYNEKYLDSSGMEISNKKEVEKVVSQGTLILTPANAAHLVEALEDSVIIEPIFKEKLTYDYSPYRKLAV